MKTLLSIIAFCALAIGASAQVPPFVRQYLTTGTVAAAQANLHSNTPAILGNSSSNSGLSMGPLGAAYAWRLTNIAATSNLQALLGTTVGFSLWPNGSMGLGVVNPSLLNGVLYPGQNFHVSNNVQASVCVNSAGTSAYVWNDPSAILDCKTWEMHTGGGNSNMTLLTVKDDGTSLATIMQFKHGGEVAFGTTATAGLSFHLLGVHTANKGMAYFDSASYGYIGVNGGSALGSGVILNHADTVMWILQSPGNTSDFDIGETSAGTSRLRVKASTGNVGINTTAPAYSLDVYGTVKASNNVVFATGTIAGAGNGSTNYTILTTGGHRSLGSSNVNISAVMGFVSGEAHYWNVTITNLSAIAWGIGFSDVTNNWSFVGGGGQTNRPVVLTNGMALELEGRCVGSNTFVRYAYTRALQP